VSYRGCWHRVSRGFFLESYHDRELDKRALQVALPFFTHVIKVSIEAGLAKLNVDVTVSRNDARGASVAIGRDNHGNYLGASAAVCMDNHGNYLGASTVVFVDIRIQLPLKRSCVEKPLH
jgi:hypothetical protein